MHLLNKEFDRVICINLLNRPDKKEHMQEKFDKLGIGVEWFHPVQYGFAKEIVESLKPTVNDFPRFNVKTPHEFGAAMSHYTVIKTALLQGVEKLFIFEDDVMFRKDFNEQVEKYMEKVPENWDMVMFYSFMYELKPQNVRVNGRWIKSYLSWSMMANGMKKSAMEKYIELQDKMFQIADRVSFKMPELTDLNIYSAVPTLCIPNKDLGSNIRGDNMNYITTKTILNLGFSEDNFE